jgi:hypothetical protein
MKKITLLMSLIFVSMVSAAFADSVQIQLDQTGTIQLINGAFVSRGIGPGFFPNFNITLNSSPTGSMNFIGGGIHASTNQFKGVQYIDLELLGISFNSSTDILTASFIGQEFGFCQERSPGCDFSIIVSGTFTQHIDFSNGTIGPGYLLFDPGLVTPEPGTLGLMATGVFGILPVLRNQLERRSLGLT